MPPGDVDTSSDPLASTSSRVELTRRAKASQRKELRSLVRALDPESVAGAGDRVCELIRHSAEFEGAQTLALYAALGDEMPTRPLYEAARAAGRRVLMPRTGLDAALCFAEIGSWRELRRGRFGVLEPDPGAPEVPLSGAQLIVVPGTGFSRSGERLGRGRGCYDRALAEAGSGPVLLGLCFSCQLVEALPTEAHDQRVQLVVSEREVVRVPPDRALSAGPGESS